MNGWVLFYGVANARTAMTRQAQHVRRELTPAERARVAEGRKLVAAEEGEIRRKAREHKRAYDAGPAALEQALQLLKAERRQQGLSLADIEDRTGISRPNLSRLENEAQANPTVSTLSRYASALGKKLLIVLADQKSQKYRNSPALLLPASDSTRHNLSHVRRTSRDPGHGADRAAFWIAVLVHAAVGAAAFVLHGAAAASAARADVFADRYRHRNGDALARERAGRRGPRRYGAG